MTRHSWELASLLMYIYFCVFKGVNAGAFYHCVFFFNSFPWNINDLPSRPGHNCKAFVFYYNIIIGTCECGYRRAQNSLFSLLNASFQPIISLSYRCVPSHFQCCRLEFYASRRPTWKIFFIWLYASRNQTRVEWLNMCIIKPYTENILTLSMVYNRHN